MEERDFLHEICMTLLFASKDIRFVAVVNIDGKLIVGEHRGGVTQSPPKLHSTNGDDLKSCHHLFWKYLISAIKRKRIFYIDHRVEIHFELTEIGNNTKIDYYASY